MLRGTTDVVRWFVPLSQAPAARFSVYCFPYAGAGANTFASWAPSFGPEFQLFGLQLPGRESRLGEEPSIDAEAVATALAAHADRSFVVYGHSLGARLAYEVLHALWARGSRLPALFCPAACRAPHLPADTQTGGLSTLDDDALVRRLAALGGMPAELLAEPELMELLLPTFRADFAWLDAYSHRQRPPLPVPFLAFCGERDAIAPAEKMQQWRQHTASEFAVHTMPGGHFFFDDQRANLAGRIETCVKERQ